jgi:outer membrane protein assembly factor BamB
LSNPLHFWDENSSQKFSAEVKLYKIDPWLIWLNGDRLSGLGSGITFRFFLTLYSELWPSWAATFLIYGADFINSVVAVIYRQTFSIIFSRDFEKLYAEF